MSDTQQPPISSQPVKTVSRGKRIFKNIMLFMMLALIIGALFLSILAYYVSQTLPSIDALKNYKPQMSLQVFTEDGELIGEFGEERRKPVASKDIPDHLKKAILAIEDSRFYEHGGVDYYGLGRAAINNILHPGDLQGASTITQQLAKNFFLSSERTFSRKFNEALMAKKIEANMSKDEILERYINFIYLGERAYGFAAAADIYYGKELSQLTIAESAMLATLPQAPGRNNPTRNRVNADIRQQYVLQRMRDLKYITDAEYEQAKNEVVKIIDTKAKPIEGKYKIHAEYVAEMARQLMFDKYKDAAYTEGLKVYTTINGAEQEAAYNGVRSAVLAYDRKYGYRGPLANITLPSKEDERLKVMDATFDKYPDLGNLLTLIVTEVSGGGLKGVLSNGQPVDVAPSGLALARGALGSGKNGVKVGSVITVTESQDDGSWRVSQVPSVQASFVSMASTDGAIRALVGGFDFNLSKFNHVTQGWRQPGSGIKPFIYSAAMEKNGLTPGSTMNDSPIQVGGWRPQNSDGRYLGAIPMSTALALSRNMVSIRLLQGVGNDYFREYASRFGFDGNKIDQYLTVALGATSVTSWQMAGAYGVFANGGYKVNPYIISKVVDRNGKTIMQAQPRKAGDEAYRVITAKNAAMTDSLMRGAVQRGTARAAMALGRTDLAGKTGTTNDAKDAWFNGYHPKLVGIAWMGFDRPKSLGTGEFGGTLSLPIWMNYMRVALKTEKTAVRKDADIGSGSGAGTGQSSNNNGNHANGATPDDTPTALPSDTPAEELKVDSKVVPPSSSEARQDSEKTNQVDVSEASKAPPPKTPKPVEAPTADKPAP